MSSTTRKYEIRLSATGKQQLEADLRALGKNGQASLRMIQNATKPAGVGLRETDLAARQLKGSLGAIGQEIPALQRLSRFMGTTALVGGLAAFGKGALDVGRQFQAMMQRVEAVTGASESEMERLGAAAKELGATTAFTAMQAAEAIEVLAKNGVAVPDILNGALTSSVSLASALGTEVAPAADLVTDLMQQFRLEAAQLPEIVDRVTGAALTSKFGFDDLRLAIGQAGGVAGASGVEIEDFLTALSATASSFASGSDAGTSFKTFLQRLTPDSQKAAGAMKTLGLEFFDASGNLKDMADIAQELQDGLAGLSEEARNEALKTIFGQDAIRTAAALAEQGAEGFRDLAGAIDEVSAQEQAEVRLRGLDGALKELAAAWEALQLESAQNGGLEIAESFVRRLTDALRYLTENFAEVEEIAERVGQALVAYLVGKGITLAIAKAVAMRAAMIELAGATTGVGTAASRAVAPLTRMGIAARALTGVLGGPLSLALTAASLIAFGIDTDTAADAIDRADAAATKAAAALESYQEATRRAAKEQKELGGAVSEATRAMLNQSRAELEQRKADLQREYSAAMSAMSGAMFDGDGLDDFIGKLERYRPKDGVTEYLKPLADELRNDFLASLAETAESLQDGKISASEFMDEFDRLRGVGSDIEELRDRMAEVLDGPGALTGSAMLERLMELVRQAGLFGDQIDAIDRATTEADLEKAYSDLVEALTDAVEAGKLLRSEGLAGFRENAKGLADVGKELGQVLGLLDDTLDLSKEVSGERPFDETADSASEAAKAIGNLNRTYAQYQRSREQGAALGDSTPAVAKAGMRSFISWLEGTAIGSHSKAKGYNTTLDYDRYTGPVNLVGMTLNEVMALQGRMLAHPDNPHNSSAVGMYQIVRKTLRGLIAEMGLDGSELFSADLQDQMADRLIARRGRNPDQLRAEWQGLKRANDTDILAAYDSDLAGRMQSVSEQNTRAAATSREHADALSRLVEVGQEQLDQLRLEAQLAGRSVEEQARLTFAHEALRRAKEAGIDPETALADDGRRMIDVINEQADAYARLVAAKEADSAASDAAKKSQEDLAAELARYEGNISGLFDNLKPGGAGIEAFWDDLTTMIIDKLWSLLFDPVWAALANAFQGLLSGIGGGFFGGMADGGEVGALADGGQIPRLAGGGPAVRRAAGKIGGSGGKRQDNQLLWGSPGEFMQPAAAVDFYGVDFMEAIRQRRLPKFQDGGQLGSGESAAAGGGFQFSQKIVNNGVQIETQEQNTPAGRQQVLVLSQAVSAAMKAPGGASGRTLRQYGLQKPRVRR